MEERIVAWTYFLPLKSCTSYSTPTFSLPEICKLICKVNSAFLLTLHTYQVVNCFQYGAVKPHTSEQWQSSGRLQLTSALRSQETSVLPELAAVITCLFVVPVHLCKVRERWWIQPPQPIFISESYLHAQNQCCFGSKCWTRVVFKLTARKRQWWPIWPDF